MVNGYNQVVYTGVIFNLGEFDQIDYRLQEWVYIDINFELFIVDDIYNITKTDTDVGDMGEEEPPLIE